MGLRDRIKAQAVKLRDKAREQIARIRDTSAAQIARLRVILKERADIEATARQDAREAKEREKKLAQEVAALNKKVKRYERVYGPMKRLLPDMPQAGPARDAIRAYSNPEELDPETGEMAYIKVARDFGIEPHDIYTLFFY